MVLIDQDFSEHIACIQENDQFSQTGVNIRFIPIHVCFLSLSASGRPMCRSVIKTDKTNPFGWARKLLFF